MNLYEYKYNVKDMLEKRRRFNWDGKAGL